MFAKSISYGPAHYILTFYIIFEVNCVLLGGRGCATSRQMRYIRILFFFLRPHFLCFLSGAPTWAVPGLLFITHYCHKISLTLCESLL